MLQALIRWLGLIVSVWIAASIIPGIGYARWDSLVVAALILGVLNAFVKPALRMLSLPFIILTFGLFLIVVNAIMLGITAWMVEGFWVHGFWSAVGGSLVISIVSMFLGYTGGRRVAPFRPADTLFSDRRGPPPGRGRVIDV